MKFYLYDESAGYSYTWNYCRVFPDMALATPSVRAAIEHDFIGNLWLFLEKRMKVNRTIAYSVANCLFQRMSDSSLHYHTPVHILSIFQFAKEHSIKLEIWEELAIWFHDAIYIPGAYQCVNESQSAAFMRALMPGGHDPTIKIINNAHSAILLTSQYEREDFTDEEELASKVMDLDLCPFAFAEPSFLIVNNCIDKELSPVVDDFQSKRKEFLRKMLSKKSIYRTPLFSQDLEKRARKNLSTLLHDLNLRRE